MFYYTCSVYLQFRFRITKSIFDWNLIQSIYRNADKCCDFSFDKYDMVDYCMGYSVSFSFSTNQNSILYLASDYFISDFNFSFLRSLSLPLLFRSSSWRWLQQLSCSMLLGSNCFRNFLELSKIRISILWPEGILLPFRKNFTLISHNALTVLLWLLLRLS